MIYVDTSVVLAQLLAEDQIPPSELWEEPLASSRLLEYEVWTRLHARGIAVSHGEIASRVLGRLAFLELSTAALARALDPFPLPVRTLDALHLASIEFLRGRDPSIRLASYDARMVQAASAMGIPLYELPVQ